MFKKATKENRKLRLAMFGVAGSGKTYSALSIASGLGSKIALVDTENNSASIYSDKFNFDTCDLKDPTVDNVIKVMREAYKGNYDVLIIDSLSHAWEELLHENHKLAQTKYKGNTWAAWNEGTPKQKSLVKALLNMNCHIIATMRVRTEWTVENGKPMRVGQNPEQGKGIEYEFDMLLNLTNEHDCFCIKDRTGNYQDKVIEKPSVNFGKELAKYFNNQQPEITYDNIKGWFTNYLFTEHGISGIAADNVILKLSEQWENEERFYQHLKDLKVLEFGEGRNSFLFELKTVLENIKKGVNNEKNSN